MLGILDKEYSGLQPVMSEKRALVVFNNECAKIALNHLNVDFVIALNENTGKYAYCYSVKECEDFLNNI